MRMLLTSSFDTFTGYGNDAVDMAVTFQKLGVDVVPWPEKITPGLPGAFTDLLQKSPLGGFDLSVKFAPPFDLHPETFAPAARTAVGWSMWERTPLVRDDMRGHGWQHPHNRKHWWSKGPRIKPQSQKDWLDLMVVTCADNLPAFRNLDPHLPYAVVPNGIDPELFPELDRSERGGPFRFFSIGMLAGRKDPFATLEAWRLAQQMDPGFDAELVLKTGTHGLHPGIAEAYRNVEVITANWSREQVVSFYGDVDCLVSTSRGEGNNKPAMEFMSTGGAVMAPMWGGHVNWLHPDSGYPLDGELEPIAEGSSIREFRVNVEHVAETFLHVWRNQQEARRKGELAAQRIRAELSWEHVCDRFLQKCLAVM